MTENMTEKLTNTEKIVALLDGELGAKESKEFYKELSQDETLQSQMNEFIEINKMVRTTRPILPSAVKVGVVAAAGLGKSLYASGIAFTSYIGIVLTSAVVYFSVFSSDEAVNLGLHIPEKSSKMTEQITTNNSSNIFSVDQSNKPDKVNNKNKKVKNTSGYSSKSNNSINSNNFTFKNINTPILEKNSIVIEEISNFSENIIENISEEILPNITNSQIVSKTLENIPLISNMINFDYILSLSTFERTNGESFLGNLNYGLVYNGLSLGNTFPNNFAISVSSKVSDDWEIGLIAGLENIIQKFDYANDIETRIYEQNYNATWAGVTGKYKFYEIFEDSYLYGKGTAGFIKTGPLARAEIGLQYKIFDGFRIYSGIEAMTTGYLFKDKWFNSDKYGLTFGLDFNTGMIN